MWGILYNKGDCVRPHNHFPLTLSLSYYIKAPKGCSPLVIEKKKLNPFNCPGVIVSGHGGFSWGNSRRDSKRSLYRPGALYAQGTQAGCERAA